MTNKLLDDVNEVEEELSNLVDILKNEIPDLSEVKVFGSYNNGNWNPEKSDIDIFILIENEDYNSMRNTIEVFGYRFMESEERQSLRKTIKEKLSYPYSQKFSLFICTPIDVERLIYVDEGRGKLGENMKKGRRLYKK